MGKYSINFNKLEKKLSTVRSCVKSGDIWVETSDFDRIYEDYSGDDLKQYRDDLESLAGKLNRSTNIDEICTLIDEINNYTKNYTNPPENYTNPPEYYFCYSDVAKIINFLKGNESIISKISDFKIYFKPIDIINYLKYKKLKGKFDNLEKGLLNINEKLDEKLDKSKISQYIAIIIEKPKELSRVLKKIDQAEDLTKKEKKLWADEIVDLLKWYKETRQARWKKFLKGISKKILGELGNELASEAIKGVIKWIQERF